MPRYLSLASSQRPFCAQAIRSNKPDRSKLLTGIRLTLSGPFKHYSIDNIISQLSGTPGVREIFLDSRTKCRGIAPRSPLPRESLPVAEAEIWTGQSECLSCTSSVSPFEVNRSIRALPRSTVSKWLSPLGIASQRRRIFRGFDAISDSIL